MTNNATDRYRGLEQQLRKLNSAVESMAYNVECLATANGALVGLSQTMASFVAATDAVRSSNGNHDEGKQEKEIEANAVSAPASPVPVR